MNQAIGTVGTERREAIKVNIKEWQGKTFVDIRHWYMGKDGQWYPTKKGVFVAEDKIPELVTLLEHSEIHLKQGAAK